MNRWWKSVLAIAAQAAAVLAAGSARAAISGPYTADVNTMHLWHLDESTTPAADQAHYNYAGTFTTKPDSNQPLNALIGNGTHLATLANPSFSAAFGTALSTANVSQVPPYPTNSVEPGLSALTPANDATDNVDHTFDNPTTHAFTMEAIIKVGFDPTVAWAQPQEIIAGEGDAGDSSDRSWQFRIQPNTTPGTTPWALRFQKVSGFGGVGGSTANYNLDSNIPSTGVDAIAVNGWYHVAVTFNGDINDAAGLKLYWTKMDPSNTQASQIGVSGQMNGWLREQDTDFSLGNEMRDFNGNTEPYIGLIDEVRISDIARTPSQFLFTPGADNANFDGIGGVNGTDFVIWQRGLGLSGASATLANGNANGDTVIDSADLGVWKTQFGTGVVTAIPEPASTALALGGLAISFGVRQKAARRA